MATRGVGCMRELRRALGIPIGLPAFGWMVRIGAPLFLRTDPELALYGRYVVSKRLDDEHFAFRFPHLRDALSDLTACPPADIQVPPAPTDRSTIPSDRQRTYQFTASRNAQIMGNEHFRGASGSSSAGHEPGGSIPTPKRAATAWVHASAPYARGIRGVGSH